MLCIVLAQRTGLGYEGQALGRPSKRQMIKKGCLTCQMQCIASMKSYRSIAEGDESALSPVRKTRTWMIGNPLAFLQGCRPMLACSTCASQGSSSQMLVILLHIIRMSQKLSSQYYHP